MGRSFGPYHTLGELIGRKVILADLISELTKIPRQEVLRWVAGMSTLIERRDGFDKRRKFNFFFALFPADVWKQIGQVLQRRDDLRGSFFHRRQLWFVLQLAIIVCRDVAPPVPAG